MQKTPFNLGYRMPAEWEKHSAIWLAWPHNRNHWIYWLVNEQHGEEWKYEKVLDAFCNAIHVMQESETVNLLVNDLSMEKVVRERLNDLKLRTDNINFVYIKTNVPWCRDFGPIFVVRDDAKNSSQKEIAIIDWIFNAWGEKYNEGNDDDVVPTNIAKLLKIPVFYPKIVMEGGSIDVNGKGTLLTTRQCLLNENRNPDLTKKDLEIVLKNYLGATNVLWLGDGIINDDTDGHVDDLARFVNAETIVCSVEENSKNPNYRFLKENFEQMQSMKDQDGKLLKIIPLPMPDPVIYLDAQMPATYANFYIGNKIVIMPSFRQKKDDQAKEILQHYFPNRKVIGVDAFDVIWGQGAWHCLSQQQPL
ncbi:MAG: peptidyl-arginyl deiminase, agmatine deiminase [Candidatus Peregrinibacteria bacterium GW2011_GWF2_33_10]|nr:MAG: peptidyl-arginyl deiminase, agmatine deiminase [Candidatus Peregrinibacteria bacterium GW2011_GWF2_33_10]OGJ44830.1 MAG: hypothetical protein A2263_06360 [Candidatus Peregrinibacteria bacterium RIFOXYA2_FULL_33_21]OGJ47116.1 MAG: hypothetical protein A2272_03080 [Candidatus Peregrinibacteria bacterium RIFOXYA12_FULL_33_12]OGJ50516.1 MAG: hypothetical protein A2307_02985 [Candidatus Peregrinibacteria bacterium RIFOXYB2_FULL_33_20]